MCVTLWPRYRSGLNDLSVMVVAPAWLFEDALAGHVGDRGGMRGGGGGRGGVGGGHYGRLLLYREGFVCGVGNRVFGRDVGNFEDFLGSVSRLIMWPFQVTLRPSFELGVERCWHGEPRATGGEWVRWLRGELGERWWVMLAWDGRGVSTCQWCLGGHQRKGPVRSTSSCDVDCGHGRVLFNLK